MNKIKYICDECLSELTMAASYVDVYRTATCPPCERNGVRTEMKGKRDSQGVFTGQVRITYLDHEGDDIYQELIHYKNDKLHGMRKRFYRDGRLAYKVEYNNGEEEGLYESFHSNGQLENRCNFLNGKRRGADVEYYKNGQIKKQCTYVNGRREGEMIEYYEDGQILFHGRYHNGGREGDHISYYPNGQKKQLGRWENGEENGDTIWYGENGEIIEKRTYINGLRQGNYEFGQWGEWGEYNVDYYKDGRKLETKTYTDDSKSNQIGYHIYDKDGKMHGLCKVVIGKRNGLLLIREAYYVHGKRGETIRLFDEFGRTLD